MNLPQLVTITSLFLLSVIGFGCGDNQTLLLREDAFPAVSGEKVPRVEAQACRFDVEQLDSSIEIECGDLIVYENRKAKNRTLRLHYARIKSSSSSKNGTIYLDGGPGGNGQGILSYIAFLGARFLDGLLVDGDFLTISQRGTTLSIPSLDCDSVKECTLIPGVDLPSFNTAYNADDIDDLRKVLGMEKFNLYGISYGSRLGLEVLRRHGENVRSAVLGGLVPSQTIWPASTPASFYSSLKALDASCQEDPACGEVFDNLVDKFVQGFITLNQNPAVFYYDGTEFQLDGYRYASLLFSSLYSTRSYYWLPMLIHDLSMGHAERSAEFLGPVLSSTRGPGFSYGLYYSILCGEIANPPDASIFETANRDVPESIRSIFSGNWPSLVEACTTWPKGDWQQALSKPVVSSIPSLVVSGRMDPITPPQYGDIAGQTLSQSTVVVLENSGHGATLQSQCGTQLLHDFLRSPTKKLDTRCISTIKSNYRVPSSVRASEQRKVTKALLFELEQVPFFHKPFQASSKKSF